jgi:FKBP-type peptidyl-prolyl cis-trans isomerase
MFSSFNSATSDENKAAGLAFLAENGQKDNIITTDSGLQYEILTEGEGKSPSATDQVSVHYQGTTLDGNEFDSSYKRGEPATFPLNRVISGWTEGVQLMKEGSKFRFFISSELAYGAQGAGADIPANATLIFEVELIKIL